MDYLDRFSAWLLKVLLYVPKKLLQLVLEALSAIINAIPVPDWLAHGSVAMAGIPGGVTWFLDLMAAQYGLGIIISAYVIRFIIRRLPFVG